MNKLYRYLFIISLVIISAFSFCSCQTKQVENTQTNTIEQESTESTAKENNNADIENPSTNISSESNLEEPIWVEDKLYQLAVNELGADKVENVAADATTVKYLITEPNTENANLIQYAILYRMKDEYNMTVKFVFYKEKGNVSTAYLRKTYSAKTLSQLDWNNVSILDIQNYAD